MLTELILFYLAAAFYLLTALISLNTAHNKRSDWRRVLTLLFVALIFNTASIGFRWVRLDHGPYVDFWEVISSGLWGYHLALFLACLVITQIRPALSLILPLLSPMVIWNLMVTPVDALAPVTFDTIWLIIHLIVGKIFIGCLIVGVAISLVILARRFAHREFISSQSALHFASMPSDNSLDELSFRFVLSGFVFQSLMLVAGAIWAQDAWGRYWGWDPLETWSFLTWFAVVFYLHLRYLKRKIHVLNSCLILVCFGLAYLTFYGIPFLSEHAHQGAV